MQMLLPSMLIFLFAGCVSKPVWHPAVPYRAFPKQVIEAEKRTQESVSVNKN